MRQFSVGFSRLVSVVFHPVWMPTFGFFLFVSFGDPFVIRVPLHAANYLLLMVFLISGLIPALSILLMVRAGIVQTILITTRNERLLPILLAAVSNYMTYFALKKLGVAPVFGYYMIGACILAVLSFFINTKWKISLHMIAHGGFFGAMTGLSMVIDDRFIYAAILSALLSGIVACCRLRLAAHNQAQIYSGFILGASTMVLLFSLIH